MKIGERGQVTIPKVLREQFGLGPNTEVEFRVVRSTIILEKNPKPPDLCRWKGKCRRSFEDLGYSSVDRFLDDVRGR